MLHDILLLMHNAIYPLFEPFFAQLGFLTILVIVDTLSGILCAKKKKLFDILKVFKIIKKCSYFAIILFCIGACEWVAFGTESNILVKSTIIFFCFTELQSILQNFHKIGIPVPPQVKWAIDLVKSGKKGKKK